MPWWLAGLSMVATTFSSDTPNLVTDIVRERGVANNWAWWAFLLTGMMTVFFYARMWRRSGVLTDLEFYEARYSGKAASLLRGFRALYLGLFYNLVIMAAVNLAAAKIANVILGWPMARTLAICTLLNIAFAATAGLALAFVYAVKHSQFHSQFYSFGYSQFHAERVTVSNPQCQSQLLDSRECKHGSHVDPSNPRLRYMDSGISGRYYHMDISVVIPSYKDPNLHRTIDDLLKKCETDFEIIPVCDGYIPRQPIVVHERVKPVYLEKNSGMREAINAGVEASRGKYICRSDEHCVFGQGLDRIILDTIQDNWIVVPRRYFLDTEAWEVMDIAPVDYERLVIKETAYR